MRSSSLLSGAYFRAVLIFERLIFEGIGYFSFLKKEMIWAGFLESDEDKERQNIQVIGRYKKGVLYADGLHSTCVLRSFTFTLRHLIIVQVVISVQDAQSTLVGL